ncbi:glycosyltransferase family 2 protein [Arthrobacter sp. NA-172]|uniref:glycosyltransferase family 2 protein n=1 Tax=Arthrobacter sp. NA-172 TaxID=3367524 RepID=UPI003754D998
MNIGFAITTLGSHRPIERLLKSLAGQLDHNDWIVISAVGDGQRIRTIVDELDFGPARVTVVDGPRGAAAGRNFAVHSAPHLADFILFPNDTSWFPSDFVETFKSQDIRGTAGALTVVDEFGPKFRLAQSGAGLTRKNVWNVIEPGLFMDHQTFLSLGGFDESIGTGAPTPWQSGEGTELLLRWMESRIEEYFEWIHCPHVLGISDPQGLSDSERRVKLRAYARGYGRLLVTGNFVAIDRFKAVAGGVSFGLRKGHPYKPIDGLWVFVGRIEGITGRLMSRKSMIRAVER